MRTFVLIPVILFFWLGNRHLARMHNNRAIVASNLQIDKVESPPPTQT